MSSIRLVLSLCISCAAPFIDHDFSINSQRLFSGHENKKAARSTLRHVHSDAATKAKLSLHMRYFVMFIWTIGALDQNEDAVVILIKTLIKHEELTWLFIKCNFILVDKAKEQENNKVSPGNYINNVYRGAKVFISSIKVIFNLASPKNLAVLP